MKKIVLAIVTVVAAIALVPSVASASGTRYVDTTSAGFDVYACNSMTSTPFVHAAIAATARHRFFPGERWSRLVWSPVTARTYRLTFYARSWDRIVARGGNGACMVWKR